MTVFETIRVSDGKPIFFSEHLARLRAGCAQCGFPFQGEACAQTESLIGSVENGIARLLVTAGDGSISSDFSGSRVFVICEERDPIPARVFHRGYDLGVSHEAHQPFPGGWKTANYWSNVRALRAGIDRQKNETLLFGFNGELISACMANVFVVRDGVLATPALDSGARDGVVRAWVSKQEPVQEVLLRRKDLDECEEIFLSSSWLGIMPVATFEARKLPSRKYATALRQRLSQELG
jgi:4-amino-4-deoxychorismate lyase